MKKILIAISLISITSTCWSDSTICKVEESSIGIKAIAWDVVSSTAKMTDGLNNSFNGVITLKRQHSKDGEKVNLLFVFEKPYYGSDASEYIVFPVAKKEFRVIGVTYVIRGGKRHLNTSDGNYSATCISM